MAIFIGEGNSRRITGRVVGEVKSFLTGNNVPMRRFGVKAGEGRDGDIINVKCWRALADIAESIRKGDFVDVSGFVESREYNGKTYCDLVADFINVVRIPDHTNARDEAPVTENVANLFTDIGSNDIPF